MMDVLEPLTTANRKVEMRWENVMSSGYIAQVVLLRCGRIELHEWCNADPGVGGCIEGGEDSGGFQQRRLCWRG